MALRDEIRIWNSRWDSASKAEEDWRASGQSIITRYRDDRAKGRKSARFNILWSNTEILIPALYAQTPTPDVRRRYRDKDPIAKAVSEVIERSIRFIADDQDPDFDSIINNVLQDYALPGRAGCRVRYEPEFGTEREDLFFQTLGEDPEEDPEEDRIVVDKDQEIVKIFKEDGIGPFRMNEVLLDERVVFEYSPWALVRFGRFETWPPPWVGFEGGMTKNEMKEAFPDLTKAEMDLIPFNRFETRNSGGIRSEQQKRNDESAPKEATIREIWDRDSDEWLVYAPDMESRGDANSKILDRGKPPVILRKFYDMPEPLYAVKTTDSGIPVAEFRMYQDQARSLDTVTQRIDDLVDAMKVRGVYDKQFSELANLFRAGNKKLVPVDAFQKLMQGGGLNNGAIQLVDLTPFASALQSLYLERDQLKNIIFEIIGLADIMRGMSDPNEPLGTQRLKANFGSRRLQRRQKDVQRFIRDMYRIAAEIVCEVFELETIKNMTGLNYPTNEQKQQAQQALQQFQQATQIVQQAQQATQDPQIQQLAQTPQGQQIAQQVVPAVQQAQQIVQQIQPQLQGIQKMLGEPSWEEIHAVMQDEAVRKYRVDIETDSTLGLDDQREKQVMAEMLGAMAQILQVLGQAEMQGILTRDQTNAFLLSVIRKMEGGRAVEDIFDQNEESNQESLLIQQLRQQMQQMQTALQDKSKELEIKASKVQADIQEGSTKADLDKIKTMLQATTQEEVANIKAASAETVAQINAAAKEATDATAQATAVITEISRATEKQRDRAVAQNSELQEQTLAALTAIIGQNQKTQDVTR